MANHLYTRCVSRSLATSVAGRYTLLVSVLSAMLVGAPQVQVPDATLTNTCPAFPVIFQRLEGCGSQGQEVVPPAPLRVLGSICPPGTIEGDHCRGRFQLLAGGAPASVRSFHTQAYNSTTEGVSVFWTCPDKTSRVLIVLRLNDYLMPAETACDEEVYRWPAAEFKGWSQKAVQPTVTVEVISDGTRCWLPIFLLARLAIHPSSFRLAPSACSSSNSSSACLSVRPGSATNIRSWAIRMGDSTLDKGKSKMRTYLGSISRRGDCKPYSVRVQIDSDLGSTTRQIGELRF